MAEVYLHSRCAHMPMFSCLLCSICLAVGDRSTSQRGRDRAGASRAPHGLLAVASRLDMGYLQAFLQRLPAPLYSRAVGAVSSAPADAAGGGGGGIPYTYCALYCTQPAECDLAMWYLKFHA